MTIRWITLTDIALDWIIYLHCHVKYTILQDINVTVPIPRTLLLPPPNSLLLGFSMQPRCVRLSVGGCVRLPGPLSLVVSFSLPSFVLLVAVGGWGDYPGDSWDLVYHFGVTLVLNFFELVSQSVCWRLSSLAICFPRIPLIPSHSIHYYATVQSITFRMGL